MISEEEIVILISDSVAAEELLRGKSPLAVHNEFVFVSSSRQDQSGEVSTSSGVPPHGNTGVPVEKGARQIHLKLHYYQVRRQDTPEQFSHISEGII